MKKMNLTTGCTVVRREDGKEFKVTFLAHWSDVTAEDGEVVSIKWYGPAWIGTHGGIFDIKEE